MKNTLSMLGRILRWSAAVTLLLTLLAAGALYLFSLRADDYRAEIADALSRETNLEIRLDGRLAVALGREVRIDIDGARAILPGTGEVARVAELEVDIDLVRSVLDRAIRLRRIVARQSVVTLPSKLGGVQLAVDVLSLRPLGGSAGLVEVMAEGMLDSSPVTLEGTLVPRRAWTGPVAKGTDPPFSGDFVLGIGEIRLRVRGRLGLPFAEGSVDIDFDLEAPGYESATALVGSPGFIDLTGLGRIRATGRLVHGPADFALRDLGVDVALDPADRGARDRVSGRGDIFDLSTAPRLALDLEVSTEDAAGLIGRFRREAAGMTLARGTARLTGTQDALRFESIDLQLAHRAGAAARVRGSVERTDEVWTLELPASVEARDMGAVLDTLSQAIGPIGSYLREAPLFEHESVRAVGPVSAVLSVHGRYDDAMSLALSDVSIEAGEHGRNYARLSGAARSIVPAPSGVEFAIELDSPLGSPIFQAMVPESPMLTHFSGRTRVTDSSGALLLRQFQLTAVAAGNVRFSVAGDMLDPLNPGEFDVVLSVEAESFSTLGALFDLPIPPVGPVLIDTPLVRGPNSVRAEGFSLRVGESQANGSFLFERRPGGVPRLALSVRADSVSLVDLGVGSLLEEARRSKRARAAGQGNAAGDETAQDGLDLDAPLPIAGLSSVEGTIDFEIGALTGRGGLRLENIRLSAGLNDGFLATNVVDLDWPRGHMMLEMEIDSNAVRPSAALSVQGSGIPAKLLLAQWDVHDAAEGPLQLNIELRTQGETARKAIAGLDGRVFVELGAGRVSTKYSHAMQLDYAYPLDRSRRPAYEETNCIVGHFDVHDERVRLETVFFDSTEKQVLATGDISLVDGGLSLLLTPRFKGNLPASVAAAIRVSGTLGDPKSSVEPLATATAATRGLVDRTLAPARKYLPKISQGVGDLIRTTDKAAVATGTDALTQFWTGETLLECRVMTDGVRSDAERSTNRPLRNLLYEPPQLAPRPKARTP